MPEHVAAAHELSESMDRRSRVQLFTNVIQSIGVAVLIALVVVLIRGQVAGHKRGNHIIDQNDEIARIASQIDSAINPKGCIYQRGQQQQVAAIIALENDNRAIHGYSTIPLPTTSAAKCPGE